MSSPNTGTGSNHGRNASNVNDSNKVIANASNQAELITTDTTLTIAERNLKSQRIADLLKRTAVGSAKLQSHHITSSAMQYNGPITVSSTSAGVGTPLTTSQSKVIVANVIAKMAKQAVNAEASVYEDYEASVA
jgi:hypothetical protein